LSVARESVAGVNYLLERSANLASPFTLLATNIVGQAGTTSYADTNTTEAGPFNTAWVLIPVTDSRADVIADARPASPEPCSAPHAGLSSYDT
jgi:hypothetical protein